MAKKNIQYPPKYIIDASIEMVKAENRSSNNDRIFKAFIVFVVCTAFVICTSKVAGTTTNFNANVNSNIFIKLLTDDSLIGIILKGIFSSSVVGNVYQYFIGRYRIAKMSKTITKFEKSKDPYRTSSNIKTIGNTKKGD